MATYNNVKNISTPNNDQATKPRLSPFNYRPQVSPRTAPIRLTSPRSIVAHVDTTAVGVTGSPSSSSEPVLQFEDNNLPTTSSWCPTKTTNSNNTCAESTTSRGMKRAALSIVADVTTGGNDLRRTNTHALLTSASEHRNRIKSAIRSTFNAALKTPEKIPDQTASHKGYCRERIMHSSRGYRLPKDQIHDTMFPLSMNAKNRPVTSSCVKQDIYLIYHQMEGRSEEEERKLYKNYYSLGPGQYDNVDPEIVQRRPNTSSGAVVKFSSTNRFPNPHVQNTPGPWSYTPTPESLLPRPFTATFSQTPRDVFNELPSTNVISSYYFEPPSSFDCSASNTIPSSWGNSPRFKRSYSSGLYSKAEMRKRIEERKSAVLEGARDDQQDQQQQHDEEGDKMDEISASTSTTTTTTISTTKDYMEINTKHIHFLEEKKKKEAQKEYERKLSLQYGPRKAASILAASSSSSTSNRSLNINKFLASDKGQQVIHFWSIHTIVFAFCNHFVRQLQLVILCRQIYHFKQENLQKKYFGQWKRFNTTEYSANQIQKFTFRCRISCRIVKKRQHAHILLRFLKGMSLEVRFATTIRKLKKKTLLIQRWWRHMCLMVRSREEALILKWNLVENRLRQELLTQTPFYHRAFVPNAANDSLLNKALGLVEPKKWFLARFVLYGDGTLRAFEVLPEEMPIPSMTPEISSSIGVIRKPSVSVAPPNKATISSKPNQETSEGRRKSSLIGGRPSIAFNGTNDSNSNSPIERKSCLPLPFLVFNKVETGLYTEKANNEQEEEEEKENGVLLIELKQFHMIYHEMDPSLGGETTWHPYLSLFKNNGSKILCLTSFHVEELESWKEKLEKWMSHRHKKISRLVSYSSTTTTTPSASATTTNSFSNHHRISSLMMEEKNIQDKKMTTTTIGSSSSTLTIGSIKKKKRHTVLCEATLSYFVIDLLKDIPKCPSNVVTQKIREQTREKRKHFRMEIYRFKLKMYHFHQHEQNRRQNYNQVKTKFQGFFQLNKPQRPHFKSLLSTKKMEKLIQQTVEQVKLL